MVGGVDHHFASIDDLITRIDLEKHKLLRIERDILAHDPRNRGALLQIQHHATLMARMLVALQSWIDEESAEVDLEIATLRQLLGGFD